MFGLEFAAGALNQDGFPVASRKPKLDPVWTAIGGRLFHEVACRSNASPQGCISVTVRSLA